MQQLCQKPGNPSSVYRLMKKKETEMISRVYKRQISTRRKNGTDSMKGVNCRNSHDRCLIIAIVTYFYIHSL